MAQLSEHDRRVLLGDDYARIEKDMAATRKTPVTREEKLKNVAGRIAKNGERRPGAIAVLATGVLMALLHLGQTHEIDLVTDAGIALAVIGAAWLAWLIVERRRLWKEERSLAGEAGAARA